MKLISFSALALIALSGCAQNADKITASAVSPFAYHGLTCPQLSAAAYRVSNQLAISTDAQNRKAKNDAAEMGIGLVLFWPALLFLDGNDETATQLAQLKGEMIAIEDANRRQGCNIPFDHQSRPF